MTIFRLSVLTFLLSTSSSLQAVEQPSCQDYDVYVMRHLPKAVSENKDPDLSDEGHRMAVVFSGLDFMKQVDVGYTTDYKRTRQTLNPSVKQHQFEVRTYDPRHNQALVDEINKQFCGKTVIIVGHSNTVPAIVQAFDGQFEVSFAGQALPQNTQIHLDESDYGAIFHVKKEQGKVQQRVFRLGQ